MTKEFTETEEKEETTSIENIYYSSIHNVEEEGDDLIYLYV